MLRILGLGLLLISLYYVGVTLWNYFKVDEPRTWDRLLATAKHSATLLWSRAVIIVTGIFVNLDEVTNQLGMTQVKEYLEQAGLNAKLVGGVITGIMLVTIFARRRSL